MFCLSDTMRYFLCPGKTDMRKGMNTLCDVVRETMGGEFERWMKQDLLHGVAQERNGQGYRLQQFDVGPDEENYLLDGRGNGSVNLSVSEFVFGAIFMRLFTG